MEGSSPPVAPAGSLLARIESDHAAARRSGRLAVGVLGFLVLFVAGYMSWIYATLGEFDAPQLTVMLAGEVDGRLPGLQRAATDYLVEAAPETTDRAKRILLRAPAALRRELEERLTARMEDDLHAVETGLDGAMERALEERMEGLSAAYAEEGTDEERLDALVREMMEEYRTLSHAAVDGLYDDFAGEMERLDDFFRRLQTADNLTEREELEREILQAWVALVEKLRHEVEEPAR